MLRVGSMRVPVFGLLAAVGVIAALLLSQYTARFVGVAPGLLWDAGMTVVVAAFVASRLILIAAAPPTFTKFPMTVLLLPSLTPLGLLLAGVATYAWLRWKKLRVLEVLDAFAPSGCVLAAVLALAHFVEGTEAGMPTRLPWGVVTPGDHILGKVHPVQIYALLLWLAIGAWSLRVLMQRKRVGEAAAWVLLLGGVVTFLLDMLRQPVESQGSAWLDPAQYVALAAILAGAIVRFRPKPWSVTRIEAAEILEEFLDGTSGGWGHETLEYAVVVDPLILEVQRRFVSLPNEFPPAPGSRAYCGPEGFLVLREYVGKLRQEPSFDLKETR
ncbi:phosphatidylglycerol:prolipoprotein diacylglycerol transferase [Bryocella elongata]|uniref:Phosphatidylglycerol:prolipoprotein diacylglycerol transferase n=2 Tax=Bryocella elongata TaxID=863522 RepID=A0A1H6BFW8_9BACT|nr:phosphatidylglycerol:prolipoprotein diacylglycerol transferase [Bryocella elongata]